MYFPRLSTNRLNLCSISEDDTDAIFKIFSNKAVVEYYDLDIFSKVEQAENLIQLFIKRYKNNLGIRWGIKLKDANELIGTCGFNSWSLPMQSAVIGYELHPNFWGQGYIPEAINAIVHCAFEGKLPCGAINRIQADKVVGNLSSESVLTKCGFIEEGIRRQSGFWKGQFHDLKCFGLIRSDLKEHNKY